MIQREVAHSFALALSLTLTGIGRPLNATLAPAPAVAVAEVATKRTSRVERHPPAGLSARRGPDRADTPSARSIRALEMPRQ